MLEFHYASIDRVGFIRKEPVQSLGTIFKVEGQKEMISTGDLVYIRPGNNAALAKGQKFTIYRTLKPIKAKDTKRIHRHPALFYRCCGNYHCAARFCSGQNCGRLPAH